MKLITLKFDSSCRSCSITLPAGTDAWWSRDLGVECDSCHASKPDTGTASAPELAPRTSTGKTMRLITVKVRSHCEYCDLILLVGDHAWWSQGHPLICDECATCPPSAWPALRHHAHPSPFPRPHLPGTTAWRTVDFFRLETGDVVVHQIHGVCDYVETITSTLEELKLDQLKQIGSDLSIPNAWQRRKALLVNDIRSPRTPGLGVRAARSTKKFGPTMAAPPTTAGVNTCDFIVVTCRGEDGRCHPGRRVLVPVDQPQLMAPPGDFGQEQQARREYEKLRSDCNHALRMASMAPEEYPFYSAIDDYLKADDSMQRLAADEDTPEDILWRLALRPTLVSRLLECDIETPHQGWPSEFLNHPGIACSPALLLQLMLAHHTLDERQSRDLLARAQKQRQNAAFLSELATNPNVNEDVRVMAALLR